MTLLPKIWAGLHDLDLSRRQPNPVPSLYPPDASTGKVSAIERGIVHRC